MIIDEKVRDVVVDGGDTSKMAKISDKKMAKLQYLLTKGLYKDPITAVIAEWTNNGIDSVVQAGKDPIENPVIVKIEKNEKGQYVFSVEDKGEGLDHRDFEDICMNYLESTKEGDNNTIGHFGIGMKSFLALERSATFTCRKGGKERKYLVYEGAEFVNFDLLYCKDTTEENGVLAELAITNSEIYSFESKAKVKLAYYDTAVLIIKGVVVKNDIFRSELFQYSSNAGTGEMHLTLKDVYYPIDWAALGIQRINIPIAIRLGLEEGLIPTPSREAYITNEKTKRLLLGKIEKVSDWLVSKYNETVKEFKDFLTAYPYLGVSHHDVSIVDGKEFGLDEIAKYSKIQFEKPRVTGIVIKDGNYYKYRLHNLMTEYIPVSYTTSRNEMVSKRNRFPYYPNCIATGTKVVRVNDTPVGNIREYLKKTYGGGVLYVKRNPESRKLRVKLDSNCYYNVLELNKEKKSEWRKIIKEFNFVVKSISDTFTDGTDVESRPDYVKWLEQKKLDQKNNRGKSTSTYKGLNKQDGDITMAWAYDGLRGTSFKKEAIKISSLTSNKFLTVVVTEDDDLEVIKKIYEMAKFDNVKFALVGRKEVKKIPNHYQFINWKKFMSRECKPFMRLASAILFEEVIGDYNTIGRYGDDIFKRVFRTMTSDKDKLQKYVNEHIRYIDVTVKGIIIDVATQYELFDKSLWEEYTRLKKDIKKYDFVTIFKTPSYGNDEEAKRYERVVNQMLLFRKKYYDDLPEGAKIVFEDKK